MLLLQRIIRWFLPAEQHFFDHVDAAAIATDESARGMADLCRATTLDGRATLIDKIRDAEHAGDKAMRDMADALDVTFVTPIDREDLYALVSSIETVSDVVLATAQATLLHQMGRLPEGALDLADLLARSTGHLREATPLLRNHGRDQAKIRAACLAVERLEHDADVVFRRVIAERFAEEKDAIQLLKDKEFLEGLEDSVDRCASAARVLEHVVIKNG